MNKHLVSVASGIVSAALVAGAVAGLGVIGCRAKPKAGPAQRPIVAVQPPALAQAWRVNLNLRNQKVTALHLSDDYLFAQTSGNESYVFDRAAGTRVHVSKVNGKAKAPVVLKDFIVYPTESTLEVFNRMGRFVRSIKLGNTARTGAVTAAGKVVVGADQGGRGRVLFVDVSKPYSDITPILTLGGLTAKPAARGGLTFVGSEDGSVYAISEELNAAWALPGGVFKTEGRIIADLAADTGTSANVYIASTDTKLYALNATTGQVRWQYYAGVSLTEGATVTPENVYLNVPGSGLVAIDKAGSDPVRKARWTLRDATKLLAEDAQNAYVLGSNNRIYGADKKTGRVRFFSDRKDLRVFAQNTKDSTVFAATPGGEVVAATPVLTAGKMGELVKINQAAPDDAVAGR